MKTCYIVLIHNEINYTLMTLKSILKQKSDTYNFDIFCVDNASKLEISIIIKEFCVSHGIRYIYHDENNGYAGGNNYAWNIVRNENYDYVFIGNNDIKLFNDKITEKILQVMEGNDNIAILGTNLVDHNHNKIKYSRFANYIVRKEKINNYITNDFKSVSTVVGCFFCIRVSCVDGDLFEESFFMYSEEQNLEYKLMQKGYYVGVLSDDVYTVMHYGGFFDFSTQSNWALYLNSRNTVLTLQNFRLGRRFCYISIYFFIVVKNAIRNRRISPFKGFLKGLYLMGKNRRLVYKDSLTIVSTK